FVPAAGLPGSSLFPYATLFRSVPVAADSGGVATGPLANSFLLALALGASSATGIKDPVVNGFGLVALIALAPVMSLMAVGVLVRSEEHTSELQSRENLVCRLLL